MEKNYSYDDLIAGTVEVCQVLEPVYDLVDLTDGVAYERSMKPFSRPMRLLFAVDSYMAEVYNGGHDQFFFNSTGVVWKDALEGLEAIGSKEAYAILKRVIGRFGREIPDDADARRDMMDEIEDGLFDEDDQAFYDMSEDLSQLENAYIQRSADALV